MNEQTHQVQIPLQSPPEERPRSPKAAESSSSRPRRLLSSSSRQTLARSLACLPAPMFCYAIAREDDCSSNRRRVPEVPKRRISTCNVARDSIDHWTRSLNCQRQTKLARLLRAPQVEFAPLASSGCSADRWVDGPRLQALSDCCIECALYTLPSAIGGVRHHPDGPELKMPRPRLAAINSAASQCSRVPKHGLPRTLSLYRDPTFSRPHDSKGNSLASLQLER